MSNIGGRHERILSIYDSLLNGEDFNLNSSADYFCVSKKTIKRDIDDIWNLSMAIKSCLKIKIKYNRLTKPTYKERVIEPVGIMFSDYYFYLIAFIPEKKDKVSYCL